jgi:hypothetical protein
VGKVDDLEPLMAKADPSAHQLSATVGPAPRLAAHHPSYGVGVGDRAVEAYFTGYAAHGRRVCLSILMGMARGDEDRCR